MMHRTETMASGPMGTMVGMADIDAIDLPAGKPVVLAPDGLHVMLMGLRHPLVQGQTIALTFTFAHAGSITVQAPIAALGARTAP